MTQKFVALLGRRDTPTDAVEEYCRFLGAALTVHGYEMEIARVAWAERGWPAALAELKGEAGGWRGRGAGFLRGCCACWTFCAMRERGLEWCFTIPSRLPGRGWWIGCGV